jgi:hypothetical protein
VGLGAHQVVARDTFSRQPSADERNVPLTAKG